MVPVHISHQKLNKKQAFLPLPITVLTWSLMVTLFLRILNHAQEELVEGLTGQIDTLLSKTELTQ